MKIHTILDYYLEVWNKYRNFAVDLIDKELRVWQQQPQEDTALTQ